MLVSHKHKLVIFTLERTASTSIHFVLDKYFDVSIDTSLLHLTLKHVPAATFKTLIEPFLPENYYKVAVFRDPIDRCISLYKCVSKPKNLYGKREPFDNWWKRNYTDAWVSQNNQLSVNKKLYVDRLFDFNQIDLFCNFISTILDTKITLPHFGTSEQGSPTMSNDTYLSMRSYFNDDICLYKSIVDAGGELIINSYQSTP